MPEQTPLQYKAVVRYSPQENFATFEQAVVDNYLAHLVIDSYKGVKKDVSCRPYSGNYCNNLPYVAAVIGEGDWMVWLGYPFITILIVEIIIGFSML